MILHTVCSGFHQTYSKIEVLLALTQHYHIKVNTMHLRSHPFSMNDSVGRQTRNNQMKWRKVNKKCWINLLFLSAHHHRLILSLSFSAKYVALRRTKSLPRIHVRDVWRHNIVKMCVISRLLRGFSWSVEKTNERFDSCKLDECVCICFCVCTKCERMGVGKQASACKMKIPNIYK